MDRIVPPTPFPVGSVNCWLLRGEPVTLVDAGPDTPEALIALELGLAGHDLRLEDVELLLLTHQHSDHVGLAATIRRRSRCTVAVHLALAGYVRDMQAALAAEEDWEDGVLRLHGAPPDRRAAFLAVARERRRFGGDGVAVDRTLVDGDVVEAGGRRLRVALRPGHSPTDTIFVDDSSGMAIVADHLIAHISSNPLVHRPPTGSHDPTHRPSALGAYLESLARTAEEDLSLLHTGHGEIIREHRPLIAERVRLHHQRADQVYEALAAGPQTASALSTALWPSVPVNQTYLTLCEVLGALDLLEASDRARLVVDGDSAVYYARA